MAPDTVRWTDCGEEDGADRNRDEQSDRGSDTRPAVECESPSPGAGEQRSICLKRCAQERFTARAPVVRPLPRMRMRLLTSHRYDGRTRRESPRRETAGETCAGWTGPGARQSGREPLREGMGATTGSCTSRASNSGMRNDTDRKAAGYNRSELRIQAIRIRNSDGRQHATCERTRTRGRENFEDDPLSPFATDAGCGQ